MEARLGEPRELDVQQRARERVELVAEVGLPRGARARPRGARGVADRQEARGLGED